ncbi:MAG: NADPH-dependent FMN reductase [Solirubrobacteraceae bacterium]
MRLLLLAIGTSGECCLGCSRFWGPSSIDAWAACCTSTPDDDREGETLHTAVTELREQVESADALLICTPEYAGALPGALKNLLEWTVGDAGTYRKPVAWLNVSGGAAPTGGADAHDSLRKVLGYVHADIVDAACKRIPVTRDAIGPEGTTADPQIREQIAAALTALTQHVAHRDTEDHGA